MIGKAQIISFALNPKEWREMVDRVRELELSLGCNEKKVEKNEEDTVIVQRRGVRAKTPIKKGEIIKRENLSVLRPCPKNCLPANAIDLILNKPAKKDYLMGDQFTENGE